MVIYREPLAMTRLVPCFVFPNTRLHLQSTTVKQFTHGIVPHGRHRFPLGHRQACATDAREGGQVSESLGEIEESGNPLRVAAGWTLRVLC